MCNFFFVCENRGLFEGKMFEEGKKDRYLRKKVFIAVEFSLGIR